MSEQFDSPENISEQEVLELLDTRGLEDEEGRMRLNRYAERWEWGANEWAAADPENPEASNYANVSCQFKMACLYLKSKRYFEEGVRAMMETQMAASYAESTKDIFAKTQKILQMIWDANDDNKN
jgi:hypothetical protein